ncbi:MAG: hypothetical protein GY862_25535 [Gammaproteobacteria bacterium]|nr:hypothetical protein [Gammaproteobacteria bacterium]
MQYLLDTVTVVRHFSGKGKIGSAAALILDAIEAQTRHETMCGHRVYCGMPSKHQLGGSGSWSFLDRVPKILLDIVIKINKLSMLNA